MNVLTRIGRGGSHTEVGPDKTKMSGITRDLEHTLDCKHHKMPGTVPDLYCRDGPLKRGRVGITVDPLRVQSRAISTKEPSQVEQFISRSLDRYLTN